ncbi:MAG: ribonuclease H-like domain-containing protein [Candidatus Cloacimonetes bacterium]|nr:ribonuclease H-like domain-containing protein [Candidatus Cloacimonadota bacterium]
MKELENILKKMMINPVKRDIINRIEIHTLIDGEYIDSAKNIFLRKCKIDLTPYKANKISIHPLLQKYCKLKKSESKLIFIDTETTGLLGGTGTIPFLIGLGYFQNSAFIIKQYFLTELNGEKLMLNKLIKNFPQNTTFVSFNGKSFDISLLQSRFILNEISFPIKTFDQIDLLHISRRIWKNRLSDFSLKSLEKNVLEIVRNDELEIPGSEIPAEYFYYLDTKNASMIKNILYHNEQDIVNLAKLFFKVNEILNYDFHSMQNNQIDIFNIAKFYEDCNLIDKAQIYYGKLLKSDYDQKATKQLSFIFKRKNNWGKAIKLWEIAALRDEIYAMIELAKWEEHKNDDFNKALIWTEKAIEIYSKGYDFQLKQMTELSCRKERLIKKLNI